MSSIKTEGLDGLMKDLDRMLEGFPEKRRELHGKAGKVMLKNVKELTPEDPEREKGSHLKDGIYVETGSKGGYAAVRADYSGKKTGHAVPHAHLVEHGHVMVDHARRGKAMLTVKSGGTFVKGKHMFENGLKNSEREITDMAESMADEIEREFE